MDVTSMQEREMCPNCKKEVPAHNYVMHTAHCARNLALCPVCTEPVPKQELDDHRRQCARVVVKPAPPSPAAALPLERNALYRARRQVEETKAANRKLAQLERVQKLVQGDHGNGNRLGGAAATVSKAAPAASGTATSAVKFHRCNYCELELSDATKMAEHRHMCGSRSDKCPDCGETILFKNKQLHLDSNHKFVKLDDEPGPKASWDSTTSRPTSDISAGPGRSAFASYANVTAGNGSESYREMARRIDSKAEYIKTVLEDSASVSTMSPRAQAAAAKTKASHSKGPAPAPPINSKPHTTTNGNSKLSSIRLPSNRRQHSTELIPCEFCNKPVPMDDIILHETGCRSDLARLLQRPPPPPPPPPSNSVPVVAVTSATATPSTISYTPFVYSNASPLRRRNNERSTTHNNVSTRINYLDDDDTDDELLQNLDSLRIKAMPTPYQPAAAVAGHKDREVEVTLPCEFCSAPFKPEDLERHQFFCRD